MGRYMVLWEIDPSRIPVDVKERGVAWNLMLELVKQDVKSGRTKDWGAFVGEINGYTVVEGTEVEVGAQLMQYTPYVQFKVYPISTVAQVGEIIKKM
jgi:hypothetical protein